MSRLSMVSAWLRRKRSLWMIAKTTFKLRVLWECTRSSSNRLGNLDVICKSWNSPYSPQANAVFLVSQAPAVDPEPAATFETPAFHAVRPLSCPVCGRDSPARNAPVPQAHFPSRWKEVSSILFRQSPRRLRVTRPSLANIRSRACQAATCSRVQALRAPHGLCLVLAALRPADTRPQRFPVAVWSACETLLLPSPTEKLRHKLLPVRGEVQEYPVATALLRDTLFLHRAFAAARNSFPPLPDAPGRSPDTQPAKYRWIASRANRWHDRGNRGDPDRSAALPAPPADWLLLPAIALSEFVRFRDQFCRQPFEDVEWLQRRSLARAARSPAVDVLAPCQDQCLMHVLTARSRNRPHALPYTFGRD